MKLHIRNVLSFFSVVAMGVCTANAALLSPGSSISLTAEPGPIGGSVIGSSTVFFVAPTFSGTLVSKVISGDTSNPFAGGLTFTYELSNESFSPDPIDRFTLSSYLGFSVDASYPSGSLVGSIVPTSVTRNGSGNQISFNYTGPFEGTLIPGSASVLLVLQTSATSFQDSFAAIINSSSVNVATFAPLAVPEPATGALLILGALSLIVRRKK
ncbi:MAG TPA: PEP-CTERM sorting domain-containing protein [Verrucomicrobiae bacterium]|nr:PEP-CTERM sorting domain-containing protein [Verrucomicrobiae bacterium]